MIDVGGRMRELNNQGRFRQTINLFEDNFNNRKNNKPTTLAINQYLKALIETNDIEKAMDFDKNVLQDSLRQNPFVQSNLIRLYMTCGQIEKALNIYQASNKNNIVLLNHILHGLAHNKQYQQAFNLLSTTEIDFNQHTLSILFKICAEISNTEAFTFGKAVYEKFSSQCHDNSVVMSCVLEMFIKCGNITIAQSIYRQMKSKNIYFDAIMMKGYLSNGMPQEAIAHFHTVMNPDELIVILFLTACGDLKTSETFELAEKNYRKLPKNLRESNKVLSSMFYLYIKFEKARHVTNIFEKLHRDVMHFGQMMKFHNQSNEHERTWLLYQRMKTENVRPNEIIFTLVIDALSNIGDQSLAKKLVSDIPKASITNSWIQVGLIDLWGKVGLPTKSKEIYDGLTVRTSVVYASIINALGLNGLAHQTLEIFESMPMKDRDEWVYVCILNACSHSGLVQQATAIFKSDESNIFNEKIVTSMIDTLSRSFLFDDAIELLNKYEIKNNPSIPMYMSILSSARNEKNIDIGQQIFDRMMLKFDRTISSDALTSAVVLLANTYALNGDYEKAALIRGKIDKDHLRKKTFRAHDQSNSYFNEINDEIKRLQDELIADGYQAETAWITKDIGPDQTAESVLCGHSERLAIAFNFVRLDRPRQIQIINNLRVCGDCHQVIKRIASLRQCLTTVRDANRIHHFQPNGQCSCQDHF